MSLLAYGPLERMPVSPLARRLGRWAGLPAAWLCQVLRNAQDILRVMDLVYFRPLPAGLVGLDHPWVTGREPQSQRWIWEQNVIFKTPRCPNLDRAHSDAAILRATGRFLANRVRQSAVVPEIPLGPRRRMPHAINYMHGASHYNSGIILLNNLREGYRHLTDRRFRRELRRFVAQEQREVLIVFRDRDYSLREYAYFSCCLRLSYSWFCNPNGPRGNVLWGNFSPYPAANLITGAWARDVYALRNGAEEVVRPPVRSEDYFQNLPEVAGREQAEWPERMLAWINYQRIRLRGRKGGMRFADRETVYADQIERLGQRGKADLPQGEWL